MNELLEQILNQFTGQNVNYSENGESGGYVSLEDFYWHKYEDSFKEILFLETYLDDKHFFINLDCLEEYVYNALTNEVTVFMESGRIIQLWID